MDIQLFTLICNQNYSVMDTSIRAGYTGDTVILHNIIVVSQVIISAQASSDLETQSSPWAYLCRLIPHLPEF